MSEANYKLLTLLNPAMGGCGLRPHLTGCKLFLTSLALAKKN